jgi:hypothetical protein
MDVRLSRVDLNKTRETWPDHVPFSPALIYRRPTEHVERWQVVTSPIFVSRPYALSESYQDPYVRIPLFEYQLSPDSDVALAEMLQLGLAGVNNILTPVKTMHVVTGFPVDLVYSGDKLTALRYWFGLAYLLKE